MKTPETEATKDGQPSGLAVAPCSASFYKKHAYVHGVRDRELEKLSPAMWELLWEANAFGGRAPYDTIRLSTRRTLAGKGLFDGWQLTTLGRRALLVEWREPNTEVTRAPRRVE